MKIAIFGATGKTGLQVVQQALAQGLAVKAFVRDPQKMTIKNQKLTVVVGDILNSQTIDEGTAGVDAVVLALGSDKPVLAEGTANIITAMKKYSLKRLIIESSYPMSGSLEGMAFLKGKGMTEEQIKTMFGVMIADKIKQEVEVAASGLDWIIVRPLILTDGERTGQYRIGETLEIKPEDTISRADVADFILRQLTSGDWLHKKVAISY